MLSPSSRRAWIEILYQIHRVAACMSPSSRRAWIEIAVRTDCCSHWSVALLAEGVDRNLSVIIFYHIFWVALLAEGVDRNLTYHRKKSAQKKSPSSRRAWIEIALGDDVDDSDYVALLAEGVDRNCNIWQGKSCRSMSPSSRRAWIEMSATMHSMLKLDVALLAEGVDRNDLLCAVCAGGRGRPPRGGRG